MPRVENAGGQVDPGWAVGPIAVRLFFTGRGVTPRMVGPMLELALRGLRRPAESGH